MDKELLYRFFSGDAARNEETRVLDWLEADPAHQRELLAARRVFDAMLLHAPERPVARKRSLLLPVWVREVSRYAAAVLLALVVGGGYVSYRNEQLLLATNTISVPAGQRVDVTLPDGTKVCMNALSELKYPTFFAGKTRNVELRGEAFFDVAHDEDHPFVVGTYCCNVEVLGTKFDVEADPVADEFSVSLVEGGVRVSDCDDATNVVHLRPSEQASFRNKRFQVARIPEGEDFLWRDGLIAFRNTAFGELLHEFEKYYGVKIEVRRKELPAVVFSGKIRISEGIDHAMWILQQSAKFSYVRNPTRDVIYIQ